MPQNRSSSSRSSTKAKTISPKKKSASKKAPNKKTAAPKRVKKSASEQITLPNNVPLRLKEKVAVYREEFSSLWNPALIQIAMVGGFCFVAFGASLALLDSYKGVPLTAQIADSFQSSEGGDPVSDPVSEPVDVQADSTGEVPVSEQNQQTIDPAEYEFPVEFSLSKPEPVSGLVDIKISVQQAQRVKVRLVGVETSTIENLGDATKIASSVWRAQLNSADLPNGIYTILVEIENEFTKYNQSIGKFAVENTIVVDTTEDAETDNNALSGTNEPLQGQVESASTDNVEEEPEPTTQLAQASTPPLTLELLDTIPKHIEKPIEVEFSLNQADSSTLRPYFLARNVSRVITYKIDVNTLLNDKYRLNIDPNRLPAGQYSIQVAARDTSGAYKNQTLGAFFLGNDDEYEEFLEAGGVIGQFGVLGEEAEEESVTPTTQETNNEPVFALRHSGSVLTGAVVIRVEANTSLSQLGLYARNQSTGNERFITSSSELFGEPVFRVNTTNVNGTGARIANGQYSFYAKGLNAAGNTVTSDALVLSVSNSITSDTSTDIGTLPTADDTTSTVERDTSWDEDLKIEQNYDRLSAADTVKDQTESLLRNEEETIKTLLKEYANAEASGDETAISEAKASLDAKREQIVFSAKQSDDLEDVSATIDRLIAERVENLQQRVQTFEAIKREREEVADSANLDSDGDGISDIDERTLYRTDPEKADSDDDGVADADELVQGRNPTNASEDQAIFFESPKESLALVREDTLNISQLRTVPTDVEAERSPGADGKVEIWGKALPNSFVTIYVFSTPIVVTVKTDADGSFVYTLDRELEDGNHDVYVAVTDNTGAIVAQSNPFSFIKQAQAFTPVDAAESIVVSDESAIAPTSALSSFGTIAGLGVLSLGLILLMLGVTLRLRQPELAAGRIVENDESIPDKKDTPVPLAVSERKFDHIDASDS